MHARVERQTNRHCIENNGERRWKHSLALAELPTVSINRVTIESNLCMRYSNCSSCNSLRRSRSPGVCWLVFLTLMPATDLKWMKAELNTRFHVSTKSITKSQTWLYDMHSLRDGAYQLIDYWVWLAFARLPYLFNRSSFDEHGRWRILSNSIEPDRLPCISQKWCGHVDSELRHMNCQCRKLMKLN